MGAGLAKGLFRVGLGWIQAWFSGRFRVCLRRVDLGWFRVGLGWV